MHAEPAPIVNSEQDPFVGSFRVSVREALMEIAISTLAFWITLQLSNSPDTAMLSGAMAMLGFRALDFDSWNTKAKKRTNTELVPIISLGHGMALFHLFCLVAWAGYLDNGRTDKIIKAGLFLLSAMALVAATKYAWLLFKERKG